MNSVARRFASCPSLPARRPVSLPGAPGAESLDRQVRSPFRKHRQPILDTGPEVRFLDLAQKGVAECTTFGACWMSLSRLFSPPRAAAAPSACGSPPRPAPAPGGVLACVITPAGDVAPASACAVRAGPRRSIRRAALENSRGGRGWPGPAMSSSTVPLAVAIRRSAGPYSSRRWSRSVASGAATANVRLASPSSGCGCAARRCPARPPDPRRRPRSLAAARSRPTGPVPRATMAGVRNLRLRPDCLRRVGRPRLAIKRQADHRPAPSISEWSEQSLHVLRHRCIQGGICSTIGASARARPVLLPARPGDR